MFALSYVMSLFKVRSSRKNLISLYSIFVFALKTSPKQPEALTNPKSMEKDDKVKIRNKICAEKVFTARAEMEFMTDSEESGLEYESATDHEHDDDTLVHGDEPDDDVEDILDDPLLQLKIQVHTPCYD